jgi:transposase
MVYCPISKDLKDCALWLISHGYASEDICNLFNISKRSLNRWRQNDHIYRSIILPPNPMHCHPHILNPDMTHDLYTLLEKAPEMYLYEIQKWIALIHEVHISRTALHQSICNMGITYKLHQRAAAERNKDFWQEWKQDANIHFSASQMVFVDETSKDEHTIYWHYGCSITETHATVFANFI